MPHVAVTASILLLEEGPVDHHEGARHDVAGIGRAARILCGDRHEIYQYGDAGIDPAAPCVVFATSGRVTRCIDFAVAAKCGGSDALSVGSLMNRMPCMHSCS